MTSDLIATISSLLNTGESSDDVLEQIGRVIDEHNKRDEQRLEPGDLVIYPETGVIMRLLTVYGPDARVFGYGTVVGQDDRELPIHSADDVTLLASAHADSVRPELETLAVSFMRSVSRLEDDGWKLELVEANEEDSIGFQANRNGVILDACMYVPVGAGRIGAGR
jgi:hypothetical protein